MVHSPVINNIESTQMLLVFISMWSMIEVITIGIEAQSNSEVL